MRQKLTGALRAPITWVHALPLSRPALMFLISASLMLTATLTFPALVAPTHANPANPVALANPAPEYSLERNLFLVAERALRSNDQRTYETTRQALLGYPLLQYLDYRRLVRNLGSASPDAVADFLRDYPDGPLAQMLRNSYLDHLGKESRWRDYLRISENAPTLTAERDCWRRQALLQTGQRNEGLEGVEALWLHGKSQPKACDPVFNAWRADNRLTTDLGFQRFTLAVAEGETALARYLRRYLSADDRVWAEHWLELEEAPDRITRINFNAQSHPTAEALLERAKTRWARQNADGAYNAWRTHGARLQLSPESQHRVQNAIALRLAVRSQPDALPFMATLPDAAFDTTLRQWQLRAALRAQDWKTVLSAADGLIATAEERSAQGHYWRARALEQLGQPDQATDAYRQAAQERNFHGFLAADRLGQPYRIGHQPLSIPPAIMAEVAALPAIQRMRELVRLERFPEARREWSHMINGLSPLHQEAAARLFAEWGWHDRAIFTVARARSWGDIDLRFPLAFTDLIVAGAEQQGIDPAWAMAIARQESAFLHDVRSSAGALGIMQIMPATGRSIANAAGVTIGTDNDILNPANNARLGTYYLRRNLDNFGGHSLLSTAAYNAGAHRVRTWLPNTGSMDPDIWAELIPFHETRDYVQRVFAYQIIYAVRLGQTPPALSAILFPVTPQAQLAQARMNHLARMGFAGPHAQLAANGFCDAPGYTLERCN